MTKPNKPTHPSSPTLLTIENVADEAQVSCKTVRRWIDRGELPIIRLGRVIRIDEKDWRAFLKARRQ